MQQLLVTSSAIAALAAMATAQTFIGFNYNAQVGATSRGNLVNAAGEVMTVIKGEEYAGWGTDLPGTRTIASVVCVVQDQDAISSPETFDIKLYPEDAANPGYPDLAAGVTFATGIAGPPAPATGTIAAALRTVTPTTPVSVPIVGSGDVFVSFVLPAAPPVTPPAVGDGLSIQIVLGYAPTAAFTIFDLPGPNQGPLTPTTVANTHGVSFIAPAGALTLNGRRNQYIDVAHSTSGGVVHGITNQVASAVGSTNPPPAGYGPAVGTASFLSGVSPDILGSNPGRVDDVCSSYYRMGATGNPVLFFVDIGSFGPEIPLAALLAGSTGVACLNLGTMINVGLALADVNGEAWNVFLLSPGFRLAALGQQMNSQAVELTAAFTLNGGPCGAQRF